MKEIILKRIHMENFKIFQNRVINFGMLTKIFAQNYRGKSSIADAWSWVLFGKSSTGNSEGKQFVPRRYDTDGQPIDRVDVIVELLIGVDGREIAIRKVQRQKWVRKRGAEVETYEGDENAYFWNEVEVKESEHKRRVAEIIDEEVFRLITNPHAFVSKKQDEQRKILVEKVAQITDADIIDSNPEFAELKALTDARTLEEVRAVNKKALQGYKAQQEAIPIRIDETSKLIVDIDFAEQELALSVLKEQMVEVERKLSDTSEAYGEVAKLKTEIAEYKTKLSEIKSAEKNALAVKRRDAQSKLDNASYNLMKAAQSKSSTESDIKSLKEIISSNEVFMEAHKVTYSKAKSKEIEPEKNTCPNCHRELSEDMKADVLANFEKVKAAEIEQLKNEGNAVFLKIKDNKARLTALEENHASMTETVEALQATEATAKAELAAIPGEVDMEANQEYQGIKATIAAHENALKETEASLVDTNILRTELTARKADIASQIEVVTVELGRKQSIDDAKDRVAELHEELREATVKAAECERLELLLEKFEKAKMKLLSERINSKFKVVRWKLWHTQKNGGVEPVCVCMIHGSAYGENTTSTTERLMAGMDIVATLQEVHGVKAPIWLDNAEAYNDFNIPQMGCQMILLEVSEDKEIRVEG